MMSTEVTITADAFTRMQFEFPTELVRGEIVAMNPPGMAHGIVCKNITFEIEQWSRETESGIVACNDTGVLTESDPDTVRGADVLFIRAERIPAEGIPSGLMKVVPDLCVEVLSPHDRWSDLLSKVSEYLSAGVLEVWVADPDKKTVQIFRPDEPPVTLDSMVALTSESLLPGFSCRVADLFKDLSTD